MFEKFKTLVSPTFDNGWKEVYPEVGAKCAIILVEGNVVVADVRFNHRWKTFEGDAEVYAEHEVLKFYQYED